MLAIWAHVNTLKCDLVRVILFDTSEIPTYKTQTNDYDCLNNSARLELIVFCGENYGTCN